MNLSGSLEGGGVVGHCRKGAGMAGLQLLAFGIPNLDQYQRLFAPHTDAAPCSQGGFPSDALYAPGGHNSTLAQGRTVAGGGHLCKGGVHRLSEILGTGLAWTFVFGRAFHLGGHGLGLPDDRPQEMPLHILRYAG